VKRFVVLTLSLLAAGLLLAPAFAAEYNQRTRLNRPTKVAKYGTTGARRQTRDANSVSDGLSFLEDANAVNSKLKQFKGLEKEVEGLGKSGEKVMRGWTRGPIEEKADLAEAVHQQVIEELTLIRNLAAEEGAVKTSAAIDGLLLARQGRYAKLLDKMEAEKRKMRRQGRATRRSRRSRAMRGREYERGQDMGAYQERNAYGDHGFDPYQEEDRRSRRRTPRRGTRERNGDSAY
jgi:hypothetical protein